MKTIYYHGTSADNLDSILKNGLSISENKIWTCSQDAIYLWEAERLAISNGDEDMDEEYKSERCFDMASESGQVACAAAKDCRIVVLKIELDSDEVEEDYSCENMDHAYCIYRDITLDEIKEIHVSNDLSLIKGYFINLMADRDYNNIDFTPFELKVAECFKESYLFDEMHDLVKFNQLEFEYND